MSTSTRLWTIEDVERYLGIPISSLYKMTATGTIPHVKLGGRLRFRKPDIDAWLDVRLVNPTERLATARAHARGVR